MSAHPVEALSAYLDDELPDAERRDVGRAPRGLRVVRAAPARAGRGGHAGARHAAGRRPGGLSRGASRTRAPPAPRAIGPGPRARPGCGRWPPRWPWPCSRRSSCAGAWPRAGSAPAAAPTRHRHRSPPPPRTPRHGAGAGGKGRRAPAEGSRAKEGYADALDRRPAVRRPDAPRRAAAAPPRRDAERAAAAGRRRRRRGGEPGRGVEGAARRSARGPPAFAAAPPPAAAQRDEAGQGPVQERDRAVGAGAAPLAKREGAGLSSAGREERSPCASPPSRVLDRRRGAARAGRPGCASWPIIRGPRGATKRGCAWSKRRWPRSATGAIRADRVRAQQDAAAYLSQPDAPQKARVRAALRRLDEPR